MRLQTNKWHRLNRFDEIFSYNSIENPTASGVYVIFIDDKCTYIGCSKNVFSRLKTHIKNAHIFIPRASKMEIAVKLTGKLDYRYCRDLERKLINKIKPQGNFNNNPSRYSIRQKKAMDSVVLMQIRQLQKIMEYEHMSFEEVADEIGVCALTIRHWVYGINGPQLSKMKPFREFIERHR